MIFISLFGGMLLLLYGIKLLNDGLQNAAGSKIRSLLRSLTSNRLAAVGGGAFITGLIQSSSATSVMLVGFVSAGLMSFRQTLAVILGADIGATLTVQLIAFHVYDYAVLLVGIGLSFTLFAKRMLFRNFGQGVLGFGFVFLSIKIMIEAMTPLQGNELFRQVFIALTDTPIIGIAALGRCDGPHPQQRGDHGHRTRPCLERPDTASRRDLYRPRREHRHLRHGVPCKPAFAGRGAACCLGASAL